MSGQILTLMITSLMDLFGSPVIVGLVLMLGLAFILKSTGLPLFAVVVVELGFITGMVNAGWIVGWIGALTYVAVGVIFYWVLYQLFKA